MGFNEEKLRSALEMAVKCYNEGSSPDEACCKTACAYEFNRDQTDRLVEVMNSAITINQYKKAEDRTANFPIAHKDKVAAMMMDADTVLGAKGNEEKKAHVYFEYMTPASRRRDPVVLEKSASAGKSNAYSGLTLENLADIAMREITMKKNASAYAKDLAGRIHGQLLTDLYDLADTVKRAGVDKYSVFKSACDYSDIVDRLDKVLPEKFASVKPAAGFIDDTAVSDLVEKSAEMHESYAFMRELVDTAKSLDKQASAMGDELLEASSAKPMGKNAGVADLLHLPRFGQVAYGDTSKMTGAIPSMIKAVDLSMRPSHDSAPEETEESVKRSLLLQYLLATDDVLKDADRDTVASSYSTLIHVAPEVANDLEMVRSILRQASQSTAISPFDAEQWANLNGRISGKTTMEA